MRNGDASIKVSLFTREPVYYDNFPTALMTLALLSLVGKVSSPVLEGLFSSVATIDRGKKFMSYRKN